MTNARRFAQGISALTISAVLAFLVPGASKASGSREIAEVVKKRLSPCPVTIVEIRKRLVQLDFDLAKVVNGLTRAQAVDLLYEDSLAGQALTLLVSDRLPPSTPWLQPAAECQVAYRSALEAETSVLFLHQLSRWSSCAETKWNRIPEIAQRIQVCVDAASLLHAG